MPSGVINLLHWNIDYAEIPRNELPNVVKKSYKPMIEALDGFEGTICFNLTGHTLDYIEKNFPEVLDSLISLLKQKTIELTLTGYSHPILPLLPIQRIIQQLHDHYQRLKGLFSVSAQGFWPPELAVSPLVLKIAYELGVQWVMVDHEHLVLAQTFGNSENLFERRELSVTEVLAEAYWATGILKKIKKYRKALKILTQWNNKLTNALTQLMISDNLTIKGVLSSQSWWNATKLALPNNISLYRADKHFKAILKSQTPYLPLYTSDIEFFGYRELGGIVPSPNSFVDFLNRLKKQNIEILSPSQIPDSEWPTSPSFIGTGSWAPDKSLRIWSESADNRELNRRLAEIYTYLAKHNWDASFVHKIELFLRTAENSDARGWAPLPERKNEAYSALINIYDKLDL